MKLKYLKIPGKTNRERASNKMEPYFYKVFANNFRSRVTIVTAVHSRRKTLMNTYLVLKTGPMTSTFNMVV